MRCKKCGRELLPGTQFCTQCGTPVQWSEAEEYHYQKKHGNGILYFLLVLLLLVLAAATVMLLTPIGDHLFSRPKQPDAGASAAFTAQPETAAPTALPTGPQPSQSGAAAAPTAQPAPAVTMSHVTSVTATSTLSPEYGNTYDAPLAMDGSVSTAWVEGVAGQGSQQSITLFLDQTCMVSGFDIHSGYQKTQSLFYKNSRPEILHITFSDGSGETISLGDAMGVQHIVLSHPVETGKVVFTIETVYPGSDYEDTAISEISLF